MKSYLILIFLCFLFPKLSSASTHILDAGYRHSCAIRADGSVQCWGDNYFGQSQVPTDLGMVQAISAKNHTCAIKSDGLLQCWGENDDGQCNVPGEIGRIIAN